jgi:phosphatidylserine/phosphatidylglycerophosphate/cardiolipin synthase-like enzyme
MTVDDPRLAERAARGQRRRALNRQHLVLAVAALVVILMVAVIYMRLVAPGGAPARVTTADNRDYFGVVHSLLQGAERSIDVVLYQSRFYFEYPLSKSNALIVDLVEARDRGVRVRAVLEAADWNLENSEDNRDVWEVLREGGVDAYFDPAGTTSHSKLVIVDGRYVVVGSMNWSYYALERNNEATAVVESDRIAKDFEVYFDRIVAASTKGYPLPIEQTEAAVAEADRGNEIFINGVADSARLAADRKHGRVYFQNATARVDEDALAEIMALDSLFFAEVAGDSVRVAGRRDRDRKDFIRALDVETTALRQAMARALDSEQRGLESQTFPKPVLTWVQASRVVPVPNEAYADQVAGLIRSSRSRVWMALLDARYYDKRPGYADPAKARHGGALPSLTNVLLDALRDACRRGVDVRLVIDMGRGEGRVPETMAAFLAKLREAGGKVYEDSPDVTTHAKVLIVDRDFTVVGSTNWSLPALEENNETAVVIESREINRHYADFIASAGPEFRR